MTCYSFSVSILLETNRVNFNRVKSITNFLNSNKNNAALVYGLPYYNRLIDSSKSVKQNIIDLIASPDSRFENEVQMYLKSEISKMVNAYEVFEALAKGYVRFSDILSQSKVSSSPTLVDILEKLIKMDVVTKSLIHIPPCHS